MGTAELGGEIAKRAKAFDMRVIDTDIRIIKTKTYTLSPIIPRKERISWTKQK
jgi:phosphoglycerate dehydrogenase-like enzyme